MSEEIKRCVDCGCIFIGKTPTDWFACENCGTTYIQRKETGLWYEEDDYHDKFDEIDEYFTIKKEEG